MLSRVDARSDEGLILLHVEDRVPSGKRHEAVAPTKPKAMAAAVPLPAPSDGGQAEEEEAAE